MKGVSRVPTVKFRACSQGHVAYNDTAKRCPDCGNEVISHCTKGHDFQKDTDAEGLPSFCEECGEQLPWTPDGRWQQAFDPLLTPGARNYWKSHNFTELNDAAVDQMIEYAGKLPSPHCEIFIASLGGATSRVAPDATAYPHREAQFVLNVHGRWEDAAQDAAGVAWARDFFDATAPYATGGVYVNFMPEDETSAMHQMLCSCRR